MKPIFKLGDTKTHTFVVKTADIAAFHGEIVHPVCATFVLAREVEWTSRLFVLEMKDEDEEGIGTLLTIQHQGPALMGDVLEIIAEVTSFEKNELICNYVARVGERIVATGSTGQKVLKKSKIARLYDKG